MFRNKVSPSPEYTVVHMYMDFSMPITFFDINTTTSCCFFTKKTCSYITTTNASLKCTNQNVYTNLGDFHERASELKPQHDSQIFGTFIVPTQQLLQPPLVLKKDSQLTLTQFVSAKVVHANKKESTGHLFVDANVINNPLYDRLFRLLEKPEGKFALITDEIHNLYSKFPIVEYGTLEQLKIAMKVLLPTNNAEKIVYFIIINAIKDAIKATDKQVFALDDNKKYGNEAIRKNKKTIAGLDRVSKDLKNISEESKLSSTVASQYRLSRSRLDPDG